MLGVLLDAIFPPRCAGCGRGPSPFCDRCHASLLAIEPPWCVRCGRPAERDVDGCAWCPPPPVAIARAPFVFRGPARSALLRLKFAGWRVVATALGEAMSEVNGFASPDAVCWVPLSRRGIARRGYDQARALAEVVAARLCVPARPLLGRARDPGPQARRGGAERRAALAGVYRASRDAAVPPRVLLVDDVLTTGATASACAAALVDAGAREVGLLTVARALPGRLPARYTPRGLPSGSVVAWGEVPRKSMPAAGETTHVRRPLVAEHGAV